MTFPATDNEEELRQRWLDRYLAVQARTDTKFRSVLVTSAEQAFSQVTALAKNPTFSAGVRSAQMKLIMNVVRQVHNDLFAKFPPIILEGQKKSASAAVSAFSETDQDYLKAAFAQTPESVSSYIFGQKLSASAGVLHTLSRIYKSDRPLSARVYRTRSLANRWVQNQVNLAIIRGSSAQQIATIVRQSIRPNVAGGVSYAALRLGRTELNNAFHATAIDLAQNRPWVTGMEWHLSKTHVHEDTAQPEVCETLAGRVFPVSNVPVKPHPQCRCFIAPEVEPMSTFMAHLTAGHYRDWIENAA